MISVIQRILIIGALLLLVVFWPITSCMHAKYNRHSVDVTVKKAERVNSGDSSRYLVYTESDVVYEVSDSFWNLTYDASDRYGRIAEGGTYRCTVVGWRWNWPTYYQNLLTVTPIEEVGEWDHE